MKRILAACAMLVLALSVTAALALAEGSVVEETIEDLIIVDTSDDEDLAAGYISQMFAEPTHEGLLRIAALQGTKLTGAEAKLYQLLAADIVKVAAGEKTNTVFTYDKDVLTDPLVFTAEELGVDTLRENGGLSEDAGKALGEHLGKVLSCLLADYPYELYWYNKTEKSTYSYSLSLTSQSISIIKITYNLPVSIDYALAIDETPVSMYEVDPKYGQGVTAAVENARTIADTYADLDNYDRLMAYKNAICDMVSYNHTAANEKNNVPYGDPWQLVWVFDGNEDTNVVCEGYAKAFQYLNSLHPGNVSVISATGKMDAENHMWNIVTMENGKNYLVDVTNCDSGSVGYPDQLFLVGYTSGSPAEGYSFATKSKEILYTYADDILFSVAELTISGHSYLDEQTIELTYDISSSTAFPGYSLSFKLGDDFADNAGQVVCQETGEAYAVYNGITLIPVSDTGAQTFTLGLPINDTTANWGPTIEVNVLPLSEDTLVIPFGTESIGEEAFQNTSAEHVVLPGTLLEIGADAFADMPNLLLVDYSGDLSVLLEAIGTDSTPIFAISDAEAGFEAGIAFIVQ